MRTVLHKKTIYIPLLTLSLLIISFLVILPSLPILQTSAQKYTKAHTSVAKYVPEALRPPDVSLPKSGNWLVIPNIEIKMSIIEGDTLAVLNKNVGVWHQTGETRNNYVLAGHRLQYFRSVNQSLYHLSDLKLGDSTIYLIKNGVPQKYRVINISVVSPEDIAILKPTSTPLLTIYTCNDFENHSRLVVSAVPVS
ncbi:MAG: hypothetical protein NVSMB46_06230 [Candidatus Saccharimonadales bacterium]